MVECYRYRHFSGVTVVIYSGCATLDDGERQQTVEVTLQGSDQMVAVHPFDAYSADAPPRGSKKWGGRIVANFDSPHWAGKLVTITLPTGRRGYVVIEATGALTGAGDAPFDI